MRRRDAEMLGKRLVVTLRVLGRSGHEMAPDLVQFAGAPSRHISRSAGWRPCADVISSAIRSSDGAVAAGLSTVSGGRGAMSSASAARLPLACGAGRHCKRR